MRIPLWVYLPFAWVDLLPPLVEMHILVVPLTNTEGTLQALLRIPYWIYYRDFVKHVSHSIIYYPF